MGNCTIEAYLWGSGLWWGCNVEPPPLLHKLDLAWCMELAVDGSPKLMTHLQPHVTNIIC